MSDSPRPYQSTRRKEQANQTRARLLQAAKAYLEAEGVEALSLPKIAKLAGVAAGTIYVHFPTEDALLLEIIDENRELTAMRRIDNELPIEQLYLVPLETYPLMAKNRKITSLAANSLSTSRVRKAARGPAIARMSERAKPLAPQLSADELAAVAGAIHLFTVPRAWYWLEAHAGLSTELAAKAAAWAVQALTASLTADPEAIRRLPAIVPPESEGTPP